jgi:hypothetical protein
MDGPSCTEARARLISDTRYSRLKISQASSAAAKGGQHPVQWLAQETPRYEWQQITQMMAAAGVAFCPVVATLLFLFHSVTGNNVAVGRRSRQYTRLLWIRILASCIQNGCGGAGGHHCRYSATAVTQTDLARRITACDFCQIAQGKTAMEAKLKWTKRKSGRRERTGHVEQIS